MSPEQARAARSWLGWTQAELAERARVGLSTVKDYEGGKRTPIANNLDAMQRALEQAGMEFTATGINGPIKAGK
jgi:transcriptional regulator with XRE-family HTH domain